MSFNNKSKSEIQVYEIYLPEYKINKEPVFHKNKLLNLFIM